MNTFVFKLPSVSATPWWTNAYCGEEEQWANDVFLADDGSIYFAGEFLPPLDLGGGPLTPSAEGEFGAFVAKLAPDGEHIWSRSLGSGAANGVALSPKGRLLVAGSFGHYLVKDVSFLLELDPLTGDVLDKHVAEASAGQGSVYVNKLSVGKSVTIGGNYRGHFDVSFPAATLDFGTGVLVNQGPSQGDFDGFVTVLVP